MLAMIISRSSYESSRVVWAQEASCRLKRDQEEPKSDNHTSSAHVSQELRGSRPILPVSSSSDRLIMVHMRNGIQPAVNLLASTYVHERKLWNGTEVIGSITLKSLQCLKASIAAEAARNRDGAKMQKEMLAKID
jgi:hypothetical protein